MHVYQELTTNLSDFFDLTLNGNAPKGIQTLELIQVIDVDSIFFDF